MIKDVTSAKPNFQSPLHRTEHLHTETQKKPVMAQQEKTEGMQQDESKDPKEILEKVVNGLNEFLSPTNTHLKFEFHEQLKEYYVTIVDNHNNEVVREIPPKRLLDMYAAMTEYLGILVDRKI